MDTNLNDYKDFKLKFDGIVPPATASTAGIIRIPNCPTCASAYASPRPTVST